MKIDLSDFKKEISNISEPLKITEDKAMAAYHASLINIKNSLDVFFLCASINLLNTYVKDKKRDKKIVNSYKFKSYLLKGI